MLIDVLAHGHFAGGPGPWWPIFPLFWLLVAVTVFVLVRRRFRGGRGPWRPAASAESVLADRFARGEIDEAEYLERLAVLRGGDK